MKKGVFLFVVVVFAILSGFVFYLDSFLDCGSVICVKNYITGNVIFEEQVLSTANVVVTPENEGAVTEFFENLIEVIINPFISGPSIGSDPEGVLLQAPVFCNNITQYGITWTFNQSYECGQFVNGDWWVRPSSPTGVVRITSVSPTPVYGTNGRHGTMINPAPEATAYDYRPNPGTLFNEYNSALGISFPRDVSTSSSVVSTISNSDTPECLYLNDPSYPGWNSLPEFSYDPVWPCNRNGYLKTAAVLTVLNATPPAGAFRPPVGGTDKTIRHNEADLDIPGRGYSLLKNLPILPSPSIPLATSERRFQRVNLGHISAYSRQFITPGDNSVGYGQVFSYHVSEALLNLNLNYTNAQKRTLLINFLQSAIDHYRFAELGVEWMPEGGQGGGREVLIRIGGLLLGDNNMVNVLSLPGECFGKVCFGESGSAFYVNETSPGVWNYGFGGYTSIDKGIPEWGNSHDRNPSADFRNWNNAPTGYRKCCTAYEWVGEVVAIHMMGVDWLWEDRGFIDYTDRYVEVQKSQGSGSDLSNLLPYWNTYRNNYGCTWTRDNSGDIYSQGYYDCNGVAAGEEYKCTWANSARSSAVLVTSVSNYTSQRAIDYDPCNVALAGPIDPLVFTLSRNPISGTVSQGSSVLTTVTATYVSGTSSPVTFSASNLSSGVTASFSQPSCTPTAGVPCSVNLTLSASPSAAIVSGQPITITGTSGANSLNTNYALTIILPSAPSAPTGLSVNVLSSSQLQLSWTDNSNNENNFTIERRQGTSGPFSVVANVSANVVSYTDSGLSSSTLYQYQVRANNNGGSSSYTSIVGATTSAPGACTSVTQYGITWTFTPTTCGQFVNGDWWVTMPVNITSKTPAQAVSPARNGDWINPGFNTGQPYDDRATGYNVALRPTYPIVFNSVTRPAGASLVSTISHIPTSACYNTFTGTSFNSNCNRGPLSDAAVLTVLNSTPPVDAFRPAYNGVDKTIRFTKSQIDYSKLGSLTPSGSIMSYSLTDVNRHIQRVNLQTEFWSNEQVTPSNNSNGYGQFMAADISLASLIVNLNSYTNVQKEPLMISLIQTGIDFYGVYRNSVWTDCCTYPGVKNRAAWYGLGGHGQGRYFPIIFAGTVLNDNTLKDLASDIPNDYYFSELAQTFTVTNYSAAPSSGYTETKEILLSSTYCPTTANPNTMNCGVGGYTIAHKGLPEFGSSHYHNPVDGTHFDGLDWNSAGNGYRECCSANVWGGYLLASHAMNITKLWNSQVLFDYMDRYMNLTGPNEVEASWKRGWVPPLYEMWDARRNSFGCFWERDNTSDTYSLGHYDCGGQDFRCAGSLSTVGTVVTTLADYGGNSRAIEYNPCNVSLGSTFDFSISRNPVSGTGQQGTTLQTTVTITHISGTSALVSFSASNLPSGVTASFSQPSCTPPVGSSCSSNMTLDISPSAAIVSGQAVTIIGTSGAIVRSTSYSLTTTLAPPPAPTITSVTTTSSTQLTITWGDVIGETSYTLQRRTLPSGTFATIATPSSGVTSFPDTPLSTGTSYEYRIQATNGAGSSAFSNIMNGTTTPTAPTISSVTALSSTQLRTNWNNVNGEDGYRLQRRTLPSGTFANVVGASSLAANTIQFDDNNGGSGLTPSTSYEYRVYAFNTGGDSLPSAVVSGTTQAPPPLDFTISRNPISGTVSQGSSVLTTVTATYVSGTSSSVSFTASNLSSGVTASFSQPSCTPTAGVPCSVTLTLNASAGATVVANRQVVISGITSGGLQRNITYSLTVNPTVPTAPSTLSVGNPTTTSLTLSWTDASTNEDDFIIQRNISGNFVTIATVGAGTTTYTNIGLSANTLYQYRVAANNSAGISSFSNVASGTTSQTIPNPPTFLIITALSPSSLRANWNDNSNNEDGFILQYKLSSSSTWLTVPGGLLAVNSNTYTQTGLTNNTSYDYRLAAYNSAGNSTFATASGTTQQNPAHVYTISRSPTSGSVQQSGSTQTIVTATYVSGTSSSVSFTASNLSSGVTASFSQPSCTPTAGVPCSVTLTLNASAGATVVANRQVVITSSSWLSNVNTTYLMNVTVPPICTNGQTQLCPLQQGVCLNSVQTCTGSNWPGCTSANYGSNYSSIETGVVMCNDGLDNDCDGTRDLGGDSGCPVPGYGSFTQSLTTNFSQVTDFTNISSLSLGIVNYGRIQFLENINLWRLNSGVYTTINLDSAIQISPNWIRVNSESYPEFNKSAIITFYNLSYSEIPAVMIETTSGLVACPPTRCSIQSYNLSGGELVVLVSGFSNYTTQASTCGDAFCSSSESCSICSSDCGVCSSTSGGSSGGGGGGGGGSVRTPTVTNTQCNDDVDNDGDGKIDFPADPGCLSVQDNIELDETVLGGNEFEEPTETLVPENKDVQIGFVFWFVLAILAVGIAIIGVIIANYLNKRRKFQEYVKNISKN